jgi:hypothetical protein
MRFVLILLPLGSGWSRRGRSPNGDVAYELAIDTRYDVSRGLNRGLLWGSCCSCICLLLTTHSSCGISILFAVGTAHVSRRLEGVRQRRPRGPLDPRS